MTFLSPLFLWMLPLISVPALIHLWNKYRVKEIEFSTISFLKIMESKSIKKVKLIEILLLIIRTLIILLLVIFISQPVLRGEFSNWVYNPQSTLTAIIIDDSFSMNGIRNQEESIEIINSKLDEIKESLVDKQQIIFGSFKKGIEFYGIYEEFKSFEPIIELTDLNLNFNTIINELADTIKHQSINKEIYILTDLQANSFDVDEKNYTKFNDWNSFIIDFGFPSENLAIKSLIIKSEIILPNESFEVIVSIKNNGLTTQFQRMVVLNVDGLDVGQQLISLDPLEEKKVIFHTALPSTGNFKITAKLDQDDVANDNQYYKNLRIPHQLKIGMFTNYPKDLLYLNQTIEAINSSQQICSTTDYALSQLKNIELDKFDAIFISGLINQSGWDHINKFIQNGKHALVFPSSNETEFKLSQKLVNNNLKRIKLEQENYLLIKPESALNVKDVAIQKLVHNKTVRPKLFKYFPLGDIDNSLINLEDNSSIWKRVKIGDGFIDILGFGLTPEWSNIPFLAGFIPFLHNWVYSGKTISSYSNYQAGMVLDEAVKPGNNLEITNPKLENYILSINNFGTIIDYTFEHIGWYDLKLNKIISNVYGINLPTLELENIQINKNELLNIFDNIKIISISNELRNEIKTAKIGTEIGIHILLLIFSLLVLEMFIAQLKSKQGKNY